MTTDDNIIDENYNMTLTEKLQINMNVLHLKKYYLLIKEE